MSWVVIELFDSNPVVSYGFGRAARYRIPWRVSYPMSRLARYASGTTSTYGPKRVP